MAPSTLDLFILTFNCAKNLIDPYVFASHLHGALSQNDAAGLPNLVVFSLQEVAPLSYSFIGSYFLNPYYARFGEALNLASARHYTLLRAKNVGMTAILLYARDPASVSKIEEAECGFGAADMGNKGAVGLRVTCCGQRDDGVGPHRTTELTFVAAHLAAMEWNLKKRNANWRSIVSGLTFANPRTIVPEDTQPLLSSTTTDDQQQRQQQQPPLSLSDQAALQSISIYKPTSHLFVAGDLNYRIASTTPPPQSAFPSFDPSSEHFYPNFLPRDQLTRERLARRALHGLSEADIAFGPTYKFDVLASAEGAANEEAVPWRFAPHRWPGWCDRVLYLDVPRKEVGEREVKVAVTTYDAMPVVATSDHRAVFFRASVPVLGEEEMKPPPQEGEEQQQQQEEEEEGLAVDPRVRMPVPVDVHAWERRAAARRKELLVGWSALIWSTREGAVLLATVLALGLGSWWLWRAW
ncbi:DNase I-like protein [Parathielavia appendiculata]|uniref:DNase I-like protein n=1 Tax=Parathielavia appendiculata TaxID=2587402 RepID=A0AAN6U1W0_9PEZI|nr:DNase I-like protein [Parathielavia appendiculata]